MAASGGRERELVSNRAHTVGDTKSFIEARGELMWNLSVLQCVLAIRLKLEIHKVTDLELTRRAMCVSVLLHSVLSAE